MTKAELIRAVSIQTGLTLKDTAAALDGALAIISQELARGEKVQLTGFGTFLAKERAAHIGRNMATGEPMQVAAFQTVQFKAGKLLKERVNAAAGDGSDCPED